MTKITTLQISKAGQQGVALSTEEKQVATTFQPRRGNGQEVIDAFHREHGKDEHPKDSLTYAIGNALVNFLGADSDITVFGEESSVVSQGGGDANGNLDSAHISLEFGSIVMRFPQVAGDEVGTAGNRADNVFGAIIAAKRTLKADKVEVARMSADGEEYVVIPASTAKDFLMSNLGFGEKFAHKIRDLGSEHRSYADTGFSSHYDIVEEGYKAKPGHEKINMTTAFAQNFASCKTPEDGVHASAIYGTFRDKKAVESAINATTRSSLNSAEPAKVPSFLPAKVKNLASKVYKLPYNPHQSHFSRVDAAIVTAKALAGKNPHVEAVELNETLEKEAGLQQEYRARSARTTVVSSGSFLDDDPLVGLERQVGGSQPAPSEPASGGQNSPRRQWRASNQPVQPVASGRQKDWTENMILGARRGSSER